VELRVFSSELQNCTTVFSFHWTKPFWSQILLHVGARAGAQNFICLELEPEIWIPGPQPWLRQKRSGKGVCRRSVLRFSFVNILRSLRSTLFAFYSPAGTMTSKTSWSGWMRRTTWE